MISVIFSQAVRTAVTNWRAGVTFEQMLNSLTRPRELGQKLVSSIEDELKKRDCSCAKVQNFAWTQPYLKLEAIFQLSNLPDTPTDFCPVPDVEGTAIARVTAIACLAAINSTTVSYGSENRGELFVNLVVFPPGRGKFTDKSADKMSGHTDGVAFPIRGRRDPMYNRIAPSPDFVCLSALRNPKQVPTTVMPLNHLLEQLSPEHIEELQKPQFIIGSQLTFRDGIAQILGEELVVDDAQLLFPINENWWIRFSHSATQPAEIDQQPAQEAMDALKHACINSVIELPLGPGDIALVNNRIALHGRSEPGSEYGGQTRWLLRTYGLDVSDIAPEQWHKDSTFMLYP
ncbi:TauD/TfdA family dioxygenase [Serratia ureilytica]|uniref:TauD/TfdA family dioxygenase n=1 Tax=Serratia ureilytica TaxID=300181 RepID=UPI0018D470AA|nr:TauD/TfdA family dioxygenase [Serratia ureilytica]MBH2695569.1 TauD/TfdA family dioxygenase [Serratia marcescens]MBH1926224.1 TauD/TfdA family dioxygenase [Serratia ureilytica]MBH2541901.1 TauD/TfdA family dioxygenase [Serratia ureilytica]MBH2805025.1 TauD/TfdA family dioxygenase [Serratia marcescens]MBN5234077.1 TauD/TfdA family dioxygenase [Serratia marcescens]